MNFEEYLVDQCRLTLCAFREIVSEREWNEEMSTPATDLMFDIRVEDEHDNPVFELTAEEIYEMEREHLYQEQNIPWREAFWDFQEPGFKCGTFIWE